MRYAILAVGLMATAATAQQATPEWQFYQDDVNTDGLLQAFVQSADGTQLILKCDKPGKRKVYAVIVSQEMLAPPYHQDIVRKLMIRFDTGASREERWRFREKTAKAVNAPGERTLTRFLEPLVEASRLEVIIYPSDTAANPITTSFDVHNAGPAVEKVYASCKDESPLG